jgi:hypothetical protein
VKKVSGTEEKACWSWDEPLLDLALKGVEDDGMGAILAHGVLSPDSL